jgi:hypothetical protein
LITGLSPGRYAIVLQRSGSNRALAETVVDLAAGQREHVDLVAASAAPPKKVPLAGTLFIHPGWRIPAVNLTFLRLAEIKVVPFAKMRPTSEPGRFAWDAGLVVPGRYKVTLSAVGWTLDVDVGPTGRRDVDLVIAEPVTVHVRTVAESGDAASDVRSVSWLPVDSAWSRMDATWDPEANAFAFQAPMQPIAIRVARQPPLHEVREIVKLHAGLNEITMVLKPPVGVRLALVEKDNPAPLAGGAIWRAAARTRIRLAGSDAAFAFPKAWEIDPSGLLALQMDAPGSYEIALPKIDGYQPTAPFAVEIPSGACVERRVILERER